MVLRYFLLLFLVVILLLAQLLWPFLSILIFSYLLTSIFQPVYSFLNRKLPSSLASLITCLIIVLIVFIPLIFFVFALSQEARHIYEWGKGAKIGMKLQTLQDSPHFMRVVELLQGLGVTFTPESISATAANLTKMMGVFLYNQASTWAGNILRFLVNFVIMIITIFFLLIDQERLLNYLLRLSPLPDDQEKRLFKKFDEITGAVLVGNGVSGVVQGVLGGIVFAVFDIGPPVLWGGIMGILAFLPILGIGLILVPAAGILVLRGNMEGGIIVFVIYLLITIAIEYGLKPKMVGEQAHMHTLLVLLAIMGGLSAFGLLGIIYGPIIMSAFLTLADIYLTSYDKYVKTGIAEK